MSGFPKDADLNILPRQQSIFLPKPFTKNELTAALDKLLLAIEMSPDNGPSRRVNT